MRSDPYDDRPFAPDPEVVGSPTPAARAVPPLDAETRRTPTWSSDSWWGDNERLREWAFIGGLLGGVLILLGAFALALMLTVFHLVGNVDTDLWFFNEGAFPGVALAVALWGLLTGGAVLVGALRLKEADDVSALPGAAMLVGGLLSFFSLGGFLVGGLAAIVAGVMAIGAARSVFPETRERGDRPGRMRRVGGAMP